MASKITLNKRLHERKNITAIGAYGDFKKKNITIERAYEGFEKERMTWLKKEYNNCRRLQKRKNTPE